jgi:hypothetical protein
MNASSISWFDGLRRLDRRRASWPGEHWITFASGLYFLMCSRRTALGRAASVATGAALVARALSGRDGAVAMLSRPERKQASGNFVDVAAPWPYKDRVRLATTSAEA